MVFSTKSDFKVKRPLSEKIGIQSWKYWDVFPEALKTDKSLGFKYVNIAIWFNLKDSKPDGLPDFDGEADKIESALEKCEKLGLKVIINIAGQLGNYNDETKCFYSPDQLNAIKAFLTNIFERFKGRGIIWGSWNEPNGNFWTHDDYYGNNYELTKSWINFQKWMVSESLLIDTNSLNAVSGLVGLPKTTDKVLDLEKRLRLFINATSINTHNYVASQEVPGQNPEVLIEKGNIYQTDLPKMCNEFGYPIAGVPGEHWQGDLTMEESAKRLKRQMVIQDYLNYAIMCIYCDVNNCYNLLNNDGKSANYVGRKVSEFIKKMDGYSLDHKIQVFQNVNYEDDLYLFLYKKDGEKDRILYWTPKNFGTHVINFNEYNLNLSFTDDIQIIDLGIPTQKEYFPKIERDNSLGTRVII